MNCALIYPQLLTWDSAIVCKIYHFTQDVAQLRKDLNFAQHVLKADYESKLSQRAAELYVTLKHLKSR